MNRGSHEPNEFNRIEQSSMKVSKQYITEYETTIMEKPYTYSELNFRKPKIDQILDLFKK